MVNETYLVTKLSEREKVICKLKASLFSLSIDSLVKKAIDEFRGEVKNMTCNYCKEETVVTRKNPKQFFVTVADKEHVIKVENYPVNRCTICESEYDDMQRATYTNDLIRLEILKSLRTRQPVPEKINFDELIKM